MTKSACDEMMKFLPSPTKVEEFNSAYVANCVFNGFLSYTAIMLNIVTIYAIRNTSSLPKPLKTLLLSLAVSDVSVGLLVQPFYVSLIIKWSQATQPGCTVLEAFITISSCLSLPSLFGVVAISVDRFLAIHLHLRYQELVTHKRVVAVVISIWLLSAFLPLMPFWSPMEINYIIYAVILIASLLVTAISNCKIYLVLRRHNNEMGALQMQEIQQAAENNDRTNLAILRKSAVAIFYVYLVFLACYLPRFIVLAAIGIHGPIITLKRSALFSLTLVFLNSSLNPLIYCWKMRHIRHVIMDILRNIIRRYRN